MSKIENIVQEIAEPIVEKLSLEFIDVEFVKQGTERQLVIYIDKSGGVDLDDCEKASRLIEAELDRLDPIEEAYYLIVSSPGLDRPLKKPKDFLRNIGNKVDLKLYKPRDGKKEFTGTLEAFQEEKITLLVLNTQLEFDIKDTALVRLHIDF